MGSIQQYVSQLRIGDAQTYKNLALVPLFGARNGLEYLVLDEAVNQRLQVLETDQVPLLKLKNESGKRVLIMQGEYVAGGKQNRMFTHNMLLAPGFEGNVPVNCVQHGRWHYQGEKSFTSSGQRGHTSVRRATREGQGAVWRDVEEFTSVRRVSSPSGNLDDTYQQKQQEMTDYLTKYSCPTEAVGIVAVSLQQNKKAYGVDIFDQPGTLAKNFKKLVDSYVIEAIIGGKEIKPKQEEVQLFLNDIASTKQEEKVGVSLGKEALLRGNLSEGVALLFENTPVYINAYNLTEGAQQAEALPAVRTGLSRRVLSR